MEMKTCKHYTAKMHMETVSQKLEELNAKSFAELVRRLFAAHEELVALRKKQSQSTGNLTGLPVPCKRCKELKEEINELREWKARYLETHEY
jgi:hypothetical protein